MCGVYSTKVREGLVPHSFRAAMVVVALVIAGV